MNRRTISGSGKDCKAKISVGEVTDGQRRNSFSRAAVLAGGLAILTALPGCAPKGGVKPDTGDKIEHVGEARDTGGVEHIPSADTGTRDTNARDTGMGDTGSECAGEETSTHVVLNLNETCGLGSSGFKWRLDEVISTEDDTGYTQNSVLSANDSVVVSVRIDDGYTVSLQLPLSESGSITITAKVNDSAPGYTFGAKWADMTFNTCTVW